MEMFFPTKKIITANRHYPLDEIFHLLQQQGGLPYAPYVEGVTRTNRAKTIRIPGDKAFYVSIKVSANKIIVAGTQKLFFVTQMLTIIGMIVGIYLLGDIGVDGTIGSTELALAGFVIGAAAGFFAGSLINVVFAGKTGDDQWSGWSGITGETEPAIKNIIAVVADRLQCLIEGTPLN